MTWPVLETRVAYANPWIVVHDERVVRPDGSEGTYGVIELRNPAVFVVALTDDDEVVLVTVDRHTVGPSVEVPAGGTDGEDPLVAAMRELAEETGLAAGSWQQVGTMQALNGVCRAPEVVFLARSLSAVDGHHAATFAEEGIGAVRRVPVADVLGMVADGSITDGETIAALMQALVALHRIA